MKTEYITERQRIFVHYDHITKWIASCFHTEQLAHCSKAIESFSLLFENHQYSELFVKDLWFAYQQKIDELREIEIMYLKTAQPCLSHAQ